MISKIPYYNRRQLIEVKSNMTYSGDVESSTDLESGNYTGTAYDTNADGQSDYVEVDTNADGVVDLIIGDTNYDGIMETAIADTDYDGVADMGYVDTDNDGNFDVSMVNFSVESETTTPEDTSITEAAESSIAQL